MMFPEQPIPDHVPPELVSRDFPFIFGMTTTEDPFDDLAMQVHEGPDIIYAAHAYPGARPPGCRGAWRICARYISTPIISPRPTFRLTRSWWGELDQLASGT